MKNFTLFLAICFFASVFSVEAQTGLTPNGTVILNSNYSFHSFEGDCFTMDVHRYAKGKTRLNENICVDVTIRRSEEINRWEGVHIDDGADNSIDCFDNDCKFTWCYPYFDPSQGSVTRNIQCSTTASHNSNTCAQQDGCIVVVSGG